MSLNQGWSNNYLLFPNTRFKSVLFALQYILKNTKFKKCVKKYTDEKYQINA